MSPFQIFRMNRLRPGHGVLVKAGAGSAPDLLVCGTDIEDFGARCIHHPKNFGDIFRHLAKLFFAFSQDLLGLFASENISHPQHLIAQKETTLQFNLRPGKTGRMRDLLPCLK